ncbi:DMT family transporter [Paenibacillus endoradicis]|uniref:DMT family transporter n=1 Tax=Paenibacillus endoradicis TaxID=2972487 RepID=UPI002158C27F|nr:multidrug efflux SMR transporter [Paenibacillus endoradicis]MCR8658697.1 multidrug efflux SMR transporter [Paenibacillus endoradicis]
MAYLLLLTSIITEVFASTMLKLSNGFTKKLPIIGVVVGYGLCFYLLSLTLLELPLGFSYAVWSGLGTILTAVMGVVLFEEKINRQGLLGIALLLVGIILLNISK